MHSFRSFALVLLVGLAGKTTATASNVVDIKEDIGHWTGNGKAALVEFWAPWCEHCQQLEPTYEALGDAFAHVKDKLTIAKVNADESYAKPLIEKYGVIALPTIKWFDANGEADEYDPDGGRSLENLVDYIANKSNLQPVLPKPQPMKSTIVTQLTPANFDQIVFDPAKHVLVAFTATWCSHCEKLKPIYDRVAWWFRTESDIVIANLDGDTDVDRVLAKKYGIPGYPVLKLFPKGTSEKIPIDYKSPRDENNLVEFLNNNAGTERAVGGGLVEKAGILDNKVKEIVKEFIAADPPRRKEFYKLVESTVLEAGKSGKHYLRIMQKIMGGNDDFLDQEKARLITLLRKLSLADGKLDEMKIKYNVLSTFLVSAAAQKHMDSSRIERVSERPAEAAESEAKRIKEEL